MGKVPEQVLRRSDADPGERLGPPLADALEKLDWSVEAHRPRGGRRHAGAALGGLAHQVGSEPLGIERLEVVERLAQADEADRQPELPPQGNHGSPAGAAVELGDDNTGGETASPKRRPCWSAFCPTVPSSTSSVSCGAPGTRRLITRATFRSSSISPSCVCNRPAVSTMTVSAPRERAASIASNATAAGSPPGAPDTQGRPSRSAQIWSCAIPPARYVSAAASSTLCP